VTTCLLLIGAPEAGRTLQVRDPRGVQQAGPTFLALARHLSIDEENWDRLPGSFGLDPQRRAEWQELIDALPQLDSNRNAIYKSLFSARRKLRQTLVANGYMNPETEDSR
jgi:hypothetical protein